MQLSSLQLEAFYAVARNKNFSAASRVLGLSQPALSQRILNLEEVLKTRLFTRDASGTKLTQAGEKLLRFCQVQDALEKEFLGNLHGAGQGLGGAVRIGGFSSVMHSRMLPKLDPLIRDNPALTIEAVTREVRELPGLLRAGEIDFAIMDCPIEGCESRELEPEFYVLVKRAKGYERSDVFLDHDPEDRTTLRFLGLRKAPRRSFLDDIEGILHGVRKGWGRAVIPRHLIEAQKDLAEVEGYRPMRSPVWLNWFAESFPTKLRAAVIERLCSEK